MYHSEFTLEESRRIFRLEDMFKDEQELWMLSLRHNGFTVDDPREIFEPFTGEQALHLNEDIGITELRARTWIWTDSENRRHRLLDINGWPGDNESGIIAIDGIPTLSNGDQDLEWLSEESDFFGFDDRIGFFEAIRQNLFDDPWPSEPDLEYHDPWSPKTDLEELQEDYDLFFASDAGKQAIAIETAACNDYLDRKQEIGNKHRALEQKYNSEFSLIKKLPTPMRCRGNTIEQITKYLDWEFGSSNRRQIEARASFTFVQYTSIDEIIKQLGYELKLDSRGQIDDRASFTFVQWTNLEYGCKKLVTISDHHELHTYLLNDEGQIDRLIYKGDYLADDYDFSNPMMLALSERIHSYRKVQRNY